VRKGRHRGCSRSLVGVTRKPLWFTTILIDCSISDSGARVHSMENSGSRSPSSSVHIPIPVHRRPPSVLRLTVRRRRPPSPRRRPTTRRHLQLARHRLQLMPPCPAAPAGRPYSSSRHLRPSAHNAHLAGVHAFPEPCRN
jgi:hypothetical protein